MSGDGNIYGSFAPLRNVAALIELMETTINRAESLPGMACFYGPSGFGKSFSATHAEVEFAALRVQLKSKWTAKKLVQMMALKLSIRPAATISDILDQICEVLVRQDKPVIIDEADYLFKNNLVEIARDIFEDAQVPVILIGEELLPQKLQQWERVHGRILDWVGAQPACSKDVSLLAKVYANGVEVSQDLQQAVLKASEGSIRRVSTILHKIREKAVTLGLKEIGLSNYSDGFQPVAAPLPREISKLRSVA